MRLISDNLKIDFVSKMKFFTIFSVVCLSIGFIKLCSRGKSNFGIDFTGGVLQQVQFSGKVTAEELRQFLKGRNIKDFSLQKLNASGSIHTFIIRSSAEMRSPIKIALNTKSFSGKRAKILREEMVGPTAGKTLRKQGLLALFFSLIGILFYISLRFEFLFALSAIFALFHDILITLGCLSFFHVEISLQILAALLTIVGYSLNDTIIIFDRIRETMRSSKKKDSFTHIVNVSINKTMSRTILTSLTTFMVVFVLFLFGGDVIKPFSLSLMIGVIVGTYSSIFIASSLLCKFKKTL